jgi:uncharacterized membrane protein
MRTSIYHFFPWGFPIFLVLLTVLGIVFALIEVGVLEYAYAKMGISRRYVMALLMLTFLGSYVNIPVAELPPETVSSNEVVTFFGIPYVVPHVERWPGTVIALNLGGAVIPTILSIYLLLTKKLYGRTLAAVAIVAVVVHTLAYPVRGVGIAVPWLVPPIVAAVVAWLLARRTAAPSVAYIAGSLGTLIGADLLNLNRISGLGAPIASIGGAGTFDGIFLTGILAVLLT